MIRVIACCLALFAAAAVAQSNGKAKPPGGAGEENAPLADWIYPGSKSSEVGRSRTGTTDAPVIEFGQFSTTASFREVVRYYVDKSGFEPPNWSILGREFPGDKVNMPAFWTWNGPRIGTLLHHIRPDSASVSLLLTDTMRKESISVSITRGLKDENTHLQITKQMWK